MPAIDSSTPQACKPVLNAPMDVIAGYRTLHIQEAKYTGIALANMPAEIAVCHRYLTLFNRTMRKEHISPSENQDDARTAWGLRLSLASAAASSAKLTLDATLAGYYSQAFALIRHMLETWQQMAYVRLNERAASQWFSPDGIRNPQQPNQNTVIKGIRRFGKHDPMVLNNLGAVEKEFENLNNGAHPTVLAVMQTDTPDPEQRQLGANFNSELFARTWSIGTVALALLLHEIAQIVEVDADWWTEFGAIATERARLHERPPEGDA
jgi:hypothetical protein